MTPIVFAEFSKIFEFGVVTDEIDLGDMEFDQDDEMFSFTCRCSGRFLL